MEVNTRRVRAPLTHARIKQEPGALSAQPATLNTQRRANDRFVQSCLSFYDSPPVSEVTLTEFEQSGYDRLMLFQHLEAQRHKRTNSAANASAGTNTDDWHTIVRQSLVKFNLWQNSVRDNLSHHVLRLAYCLTEDNRRWLINHECQLFRAKFEMETDDVIATLLKTLSLDTVYCVLNNEEFQALKSSLAAVTPFDTATQSATHRDYYRVPFEDAIDLIKDRKVLLVGGHAYVSKSNLVHIIVQRFRLNLSQHLTITHRMRRSTTGNTNTGNDRDSRVAPLLAALSKHSVGNNYSPSSNSGAVKLNDLQSLLSSPSMPLCMSAMHTELQRSHHLKHTGRVTFNLFLKGIGLSMNDALTFWRQSMARKTPSEKFDKEYAYNFRHGYGKEGKRADYTPYSCIKIIQTMTHGTNNGPGECQGCPFKSSDDRALKAVLVKRGVAMGAIDEVLTLTHNGHYQIACQRVFAATHQGQLPDGVGNHPNAYFDASQKLLRGLIAGNSTSGNSDSGNGSGGESGVHSLTQPAAVMVSADIDMDRTDSAASGSAELPKTQSVTSSELNTNPSAE